MRSSLAFTGAGFDDGSAWIVAYQVDGRGRDGESSTGQGAFELHGL